MSSAPKRAAIIGPGRVGKTLAILLTQLGYQITITRHPNKISAAPNLLLITTPDNAIAEIATKLAADKLDLRGTIALHCSGAFSSQLLLPLAERGAEIGS